MIEAIGRFLHFFCWLGELYEWLTAPSVAPWWGAVAALVASLTVATKSWLSSPAHSLWRGAVVILTWLLVVGVLSAILPDSPNKDGPGPTGEGGGEKKEEDDDDHDHDGTRQPPVRSPSTGGPNPGVALPDNVWARVTFSPSSEKPDMAIQYQCTLTVRREKGQPVPERLSSQHGEVGELCDSLQKELSKHPPPKPRSQRTIQLVTNPTPGENVLRQLEAAIREALPGVEVERVDSPEHSNDGNHE